MSTPAPPSPAELTAFLRRYDTFAAEHYTQRLEEFQRAFGQLKAGVGAIEQLGRQIDRQSAHCFNIFKVLGVHRREVKTHSAFLADLLNPTGAHAQGSTFLRAFLSLCAAKTKDRRLLEAECGDNADWAVSTEMPTAQGNLDIVVRSPRQRILLVIENKIYAGEQHDQLSRYYDWMEYQHAYATGSRHLLYLTLDGQPSFTSGGKRHFLLAYRPDVQQWLGSAAVNIEAQRLRDLLSQYIAAIDEL